MSAKNLGRGLNALLGEGETSQNAQGIKTVPLSDLEPSPFQPRHVFNQDAINDLVESIRTKGVLQPLIVRLKNGFTDKYEIVGGERRWRASQLAGLTEVPVLVKTLTDKEALEVALIENLQRQDLNALEEAEGYRRLMEEFANTQEELAQAVGKSRSHVANTIRLLGLPEKVKGFLEEGRLTSGHARALLAAKDPEALAQVVVEKGLNVRQTEKLAQTAPKKKRPVAKKTDKQEECDSLAEGLSRILGISVVIKPKAVGGELVLSYETLEQLDTLIRKLSARLDDHRSVASEEETLLNEEDVIQAEDAEIGDVVFDDSFSDKLSDDVISLSEEDEI
ncbi:MAG: ParB/RepB/Spo0J family partition protein [Alphaproteobacteria bacterium]|nr:ParB/RepB/Spo0J family partition protein [Alphaproteobacteria bacterium]MBO4643744.1 ParB/RepB/Spo0J family partition protein [Alphaproteobacteria bacterium]